MADTSIASAKIQILYLVSKVPNVSYHLLTDEFLRMLTMDFFTFGQAYNELISGNLMDKSTEDGEEYITITAGGLAILSDVVPTLNFSIVSRLDKASESLKKQIQQEKSCKATIALDSDGSYLVTLVKENDQKLLFEGTFRVASKEEADQIRRFWKSDSDSVYNSFTNIIKQTRADSNE